LGCDVASCEDGAVLRYGVFDGGSGVRHFWMNVCGFLWDVCVRFV
jgi:hypothetical protein